MKTQNLPPQLKGFTLIELLVVIAIIGILATLMFPAIGRANVKAKETTKRNNLRSMWQANTLYMAENEGKSCVVSDKRIGINKNWRDLLAPYTGSVSENRGDANDEQIFVDPFFEEYDPEKSYSSGYGMNAKPYLPDLNKANAYWNENFPGMESWLDQITFREKRIFIGDCSDKGWFFTDNNIDTTLSTTRHKLNGKPAGMFLMFDGSVKLLENADARQAILNPATY